jgi:transcriptional regulator with XRE-family HTH domain
MIAALCLALARAENRLDDAELFRELLCRSLKLLPIDESDVAHGTGVNRSTVNRWKNGAAVPYKLMRKPVYAFLATIAEEEAC